MTIKKIGLSALAAATLTSGAFATTELKGGFFTQDSDGKATLTYNSKYVANITSDLNIEANVGFEFTGVGLNTDYTLEFALVGAVFNPDLGEELGLYKNDTLVSILPTYTDNNSTVTFTINGEGIDAAERIQIKYKSSDRTDIYISKGTSGDISAKITARKDNNLKSIVGTDSWNMLTQKDQEISAKISCQDDIKIDPVERKTFDGANDQNVTCTLTTTKPTTLDTYDFNYEDINATIIFDGGDFTHGSFITSGGATVQDDNKTLVISGPLDWSSEKNTTTFTYSLSKDLVTTLKPVDFSASVTLEHEIGNADSSAITSPNTISAVKSQEKTMVWGIDTYVANIINVRHNDSTGLKSMITIYNSSKSDTTISVNALNGDGEGNVVAVPLEDNTIKAGDSKMLLTGRELPSTLTNGYTLEVSMDVNKEFGETIAYQRTDKSKTMLKVKDGISDR